MTYLTKLNVEFQTMTLDHHLVKRVTLEISEVRRLRDNGFLWGIPMAFVLLNGTYTPIFGLIFCGIGILIVAAAIHALLNLRRNRRLIEWYDTL